MAITERPQAEFTVTINPRGVFLIRKERVVLDDDGKETTRIFSRTMLTPGEDVSAQPLRIRQLTAIVWTAQVIADWNAYRAANSSGNMP